MEATTPTDTEPDETEESSMTTVPDLKIATLNSALIAARKAVRARVFKGNFNQHQQYKYVSHEDVLQHCRDALLDCGLVLEQRSCTYDGEQPVKQSTVWRWSGVFALVHEAGDERLYTFSATTQPNDKAAYVASTSLDKVALMRVLQLAGTSDENAEADYHDNQPGGAAFSAQERPPKRLPAPSNVVDLRDRQQGAQAPQGALPGLSPEASTALDLFSGKVRRLRDPNQLVSAWVDFVTHLPPNGDTSTFVPAAWRIFQAHAGNVVGTKNLLALNLEISVRVQDARAKGGAQ